MQVLERFFCSFVKKQQKILCKLKIYSAQWALFQKEYVTLHRFLTNNKIMNKKLLKVLQDKCKDFGLTDKAIESLAEQGSDGLNDETSDEDIEKKADSLVPFAKLMQGEVTRKTQKQTPKPKTKPSKKEGEEEEEEEEVDETQMPAWFRTYKKQNNAAIKKLTEENESLKAEKKTSERKSHIADLAKKAGVSEKMMEAQIALHEAYEEGDDESVNKALAAIKQVSVSENLPSADEANILSSSEKAMTDDAKAWANSLPDA